MATSPQRPRGPWFHRMLIHFFTLVLAVLLFWLLGFIVRDIERIEGPDYRKIEEEVVDQQILERSEALGERIEQLGRQIQQLRERRELIQSGSRNLEQTINQLLEIRRMRLEKNLEEAPTRQQEDVSESLELFLENQQRFQNINHAIAELAETRSEVAAERRLLEQQLDRQRESARKKHGRLMQRHNMKLAALQLVVLIPLLVVAAWLLLRRRGRSYYPLLLAFGLAVVARVAQVMHAYFPSWLFKYLLIGALILVVGRLLIHMIRTVTRPRPDWLARQYREAYERFLCPVCEYPIRTGPRRFLFWTRRTAAKVVPPGGGRHADSSYTCPACGTKIYEECAACGQIRPSRLPHCTHCGAVKPVAEGEASPEPEATQRE